MQIHGNANLVPSMRLLLVQRVVEDRWKIVDVAAALGVSERTAYRWLARWRGGDHQLVDRSSEPRRVPRRTPRAVEALIEQLRRLRFTSACIAAELKASTSLSGNPLTRTRSGLLAVKSLDQRCSPLFGKCGMLGHSADCADIFEMYVGHREMSVSNTDLGWIFDRNFYRSRHGDLTDVEYTQVPAGAPSGSHSPLDIASTPVERKLEAGPARLRHLETRRTPRPDVADAGLVLEYANGAEILTERRRAKVSLELCAPRAEMLRRIRVHRFVGSAVHAEIGLRVAGEVER